MSREVTGCANGCSVLIVEDDTLVRLALREYLTKAGHRVVGEASNAVDAGRLFIEYAPDLVLMDIRLDGDDGIVLAEQMLKCRRCPMIILSAFSDEQLVERAAAAGVFGYLIKPVSAQSLAAQMEVSVSRFVESEKLLVENQKVVAEREDLLKAIENRKLVERAKGIFMKRLSLDESEAHKRLQVESQKRRVSLAELAKKVIESEDLLGGT